MHILETAGRMAVCTSHVAAAVDFVEALGTWVVESILKCLLKASYQNTMADENTDITTVEELSALCH